MIATIRSRLISAVIVCQHLSGLKNLYPNDMSEGIIGCCDIKIIMGTNDLLSADYISRMLGVSTVESNSIRKEAAFDGELKFGMASTSLIKRNLQNSDEIIRMDNDEQIVIIRGYKPFRCKKLRYWEYRLGKDLKPVSVEEYNPTTRKEIKPIAKEEEEKQLPTFEQFLKKKKVRK